MPSTIHLGIELLEERALPAGTVTASVVWGDLVVRGDNLDNDIDITAGSSANEYVITGLNDTTINGQETVTLTGVTDDFKVNLKGGDDFLRIRQLTVPDDARINGTRGEDEIQLTDAAVTDDLTIRLGGDNVVVLDHLHVGDDLAIRGWFGDQWILIGDTIVDDRTSVWSLWGNDWVGVFDSEFGDSTKMWLGWGEDESWLEDNTFAEKPKLKGKDLTVIEKWDPIPPPGIIEEHECPLDPEQPIADFGEPNISAVTERPAQVHPNAEVTNFGELIYEGPIDVNQTIDRIRAGAKLDREHDGSVFGNFQGLLPINTDPDYFREFIKCGVELEDPPFPGSERIIIGKGGEVYYTGDHYATFTRLR